MVALCVRELSQMKIALTFASIELVRQSGVVQNTSLKVRGSFTIWVVTVCIFGTYQSVTVCAKESLES